MLYVNMLYITSLDFFHLQFNNQDDSCLLNSSNTESKFYHRKEMSHTASLKTDETLLF